MRGQSTALVLDQDQVKDETERAGANKLTCSVLTLRGYHSPAPFLDVVRVAEHSTGVRGAASYMPPGR